jgi:hypothetical protein
VLQQNAADWFVRKSFSGKFGRKLDDPFEAALDEIRDI